MTYSELVQAVKAFCENEFPTITWSDASTYTSTQQINLFIEQAEQKIYNTVQLPALRKNVTGNLTSGNKYLSTPSDWLATFSLAVIDSDGAYHYLLNKDVNFIREAYPTPTSTGLPVHYAYFDDNTFILGPTPNASYSAELHYFYYPESIVTAGTTWLGNEFDTALLTGTLIEAIVFMKGEQDLVQEYMQRYTQAMTLLKQLGDGRLRQDAYRSGQIRAQVL